ncbi:HD domain-containing protein [Candidatus Pacearchaeota archaeon]|nr:HD domain-containing protein [Candidatus Pacearchaeota archaeon]
MKITDIVYGEEEINEPILIELINSPPIQRLKEISQWGIVDENYHKKGFSRFDHSVGVLILLRRLNAKIEEQVAGLLHDASHTAFSHVIDWVFEDSTNENYQDKTLLKTLEKTEISSILKKYGFSPQKIAELEEFSLLEQPTPNLCADRVDYSLREILHMHSIEDAKKIFEDLKNVGGKIILNSLESAELLAKYYVYMNRNHWGEDKAKAHFYIFANILKRALSKKIITIEDMMKTDNEILNILKKSRDENIIFGLGLLKNGFSLKKTESRGVILKNKFRYIDPEFIHNNKIVRLSEASKEYKDILDKERQYFSVKQEFLIIPIK